MSESETPEHWTELRDDRGKLCARIDGRRWLLEIRRSGVTQVFSLTEYLRVEEERIDRHEMLTVQY